MSNKTTLFVAAILILVALAVAGCGGGGDNPAPTGPILWGIIPSLGTVDANNIYGTHWSGDHGKYRFRLVRGIGEVGVNINF